MDEFMNALVSESKNSVIPDDMDLYKELIGDWDFDYYDHIGGKERHVKGEWIFI